MKILLTNDDGIRAPGIGALYDALTSSATPFASPLGSVVYPIAPLTVQSATGHGLTVHSRTKAKAEGLLAKGAAWAAGGAGWVL